MATRCGCPRRLLVPWGPSAHGRQHALCVTTVRSCPCRLQVPRGSSAHGRQHALGVATPCGRICRTRVPQGSSAHDREHALGVATRCGRPCCLQVPRGSSAHGRQHALSVATPCGRTRRLWVPRGSGEHGREHAIYMALTRAIPRRTLSVCIMPKSTACGDLACRRGIPTPAEELLAHALQRRGPQARTQRASVVAKRALPLVPWTTRCYCGAQGPRRHSSKEAALADKRRHTNLSH